MEAITNIKDLYVEFIQDIYHTEILLIPELQVFEERISSPELSKTLKKHQVNTQRRTSQLEDIQENLNADMLGKHCRTMKSMIIETKELVERCKTEQLAERAIIASLHRITRCMITIYQLLVSMAEELELSSHQSILQKNLDDEVRFDKTISAFGFSALFQEFNFIKKLS